MNQDPKTKMTVERTMIVLMLVSYLLMYFPANVGPAHRSNAVVLGKSHNVYNVNSGGAHNHP